MLDRLKFVGQRARTQARLTLGEYKIRRIPEARRNNNGNDKCSDPTPPDSQQTKIKQENIKMNKMKYAFYATLALALLALPALAQGAADNESSVNAAKAIGGDPHGVRQKIMRMKKRIFRMSVPPAVAGGLRWHPRSKEFGCSFPLNAKLNHDPTRYRGWY